MFSTHGILVVGGGYTPLQSGAALIPTAVLKDLPSQATSRLRVSDEFGESVYTVDFSTAGSIVRFEGSFYIAEHDNPGYDPTVSTWYWEPYTCGTNPPTTTTTPPATGGFVVSQAQFQQMFREFGQERRQRVGQDFAEDDPARPFAAQPGGFDEVHDDAGPPPSGEEVPAQDPIEEIAHTAMDAGEGEVVEGEHGTEGIAVGVVVAGEGQAVGLAHHLGHLGDGAERHGLRRALHHGRDPTLRVGEPGPLRRDRRSEPDLRRLLPGRLPRRSPVHPGPSSPRRPVPVSPSRTPPRVWPRDPLPDRRGRG